MTNGRQLVNPKGGATFVSPGNLILERWDDGMWEVMCEAVVHELWRISNTSEILIIYCTDPGRVVSRLYGHLKKIKAILKEGSALDLDWALVSFCV